MQADRAAILHILSDSSDWVEASRLADALGVTTRTIRNRVKKINEDGGTQLIESSHRGYRLANSQKAGPLPAAKETAEGQLPSDGRADLILRRLISANEPVNIYDLMDALYVSDSTIETDLRRVRDSIRLFDLALARHRDKVSLEGTERNKRRLISQMVASENPSGFAAFAGSGIISEGYDFPRLTRLVSQCLERQGLRADDYGLNNITIHLIVMADRMHHGKSMPEDETLARTRETPGYLAARLVCSSAGPLSGIDIPDAEIAYLALVISSNSTSYDYSFAQEADLGQYIGDDDIALTRTLMGDLERAYHLEPFDNDFLARISIHIHGMKQRISNGIYAKNPLTARIKSTYPLIYDMGCFLANDLEEKAGVRLNEDEISFLAFHLGAYLEKGSPLHEHATCAFLYVDYHDLQAAALSRIKAAFADTLIVECSLPLSACNPAELDCEIVISPVPVDAPNARRVVVVNPILTDEDMETIRKAVNSVLAQKLGTQAYSMIARFMDRRLFRRNFYAADETSMIEALAQECTEAGLCGPSYVQEVLDREKLSPTAFGNGVAIPHSMTASTKRSFLSVVVNEKPMVWGTQKVSLIMLMGLSEQDRKGFRVLFDSLLEILSDPAKVTQLTRCGTYDGFVERLNDMIMGA